MKERPILFSTEMVKALLDGRKTQTRRIVKQKDQPYLEREKSFVDFSESFGWVVKHPIGGDPAKYEVTQQFKCPYGQPSDVLWVRETFFAGYVLDENDERPDDAPLHYWYFADTRDARPGDMSDSRCEFLFGSDKKTWPHWKPSIHMPRAACRLKLRIKSIRVERLQEISQADSKAEGIFPAPHRCEDSGINDCYRCAYKVLWNKINGPNGNQWDKNPWVWAITFEKL